MGEIDPRPEQLERFAASLQDAGPVVMLNLNRYREGSAYPAGSQYAECSGREAYGRYGAEVLPMIQKHGGRVVWAGEAGAGVICAPGESWDEVMLIEYPTRQAFLDMVTSEEYAAIVVHRQAGIADSRVIDMKVAAWLEQSAGS